jgi:uncharacterized protein (DUF169 family)
MLLSFTPDMISVGKKSGMPVPLIHAYTYHYITDSFYP